jgi:hypothetical protein
MSNANESKHTPGPWEYDASAEMIVAGKRTVIFETGSASEADCRLLAAAPELLAELEQLVRTVEMMGNDIPVNVGVSVLSSKEIIAKAEGR